MQKSKVGLLGLFVPFWLIITNLSVYACSCARPPSPCVAFGSAKAVFIGRAIKGSIPNKYEYKGETHTSYSGDVLFEVKESFAGAPGKQITVYATPGGMCFSQSFNLGDTYLVYAYESRERKLTVSGCGRTTSLETFNYTVLKAEWLRTYHKEREEELNAELDFLRHLPHKGSGAKIYGQVIARTRTFQPKPQEEEMPVSDVQITIQGPKKSFAVTTDSEGKFLLPAMSPGQYNLTATLPDGYIEAYENALKYTFEVQDRGCGEATFRLRANGKISGRVIDAHGLPLPKALVQLISANYQAKEIQDGQIKFAEVEEAVADETGRFEIHPLPPGRYLLGVNLTMPTPNSPYPRVFYPGVTDSSQATVVTVGLGQEVANYNFILDSTVEQQEIKGQVLWPDGTPVVHAEVTLEHPAKYNEDRDEVETDEKGVFRLKGLKGHQYHIRVHWRNGESRAGRPTQGPKDVMFANAKSAVFTLNDKLGAQKLVLVEIEKYRTTNK